MSRVRFVAAIAALMTFVAVPSFSQTTNAGAANGQAGKSKTLQTVQVLGSRIKKAAMVNQTPVITITSEDIQDSGLASIGDILQQLAISGSAISTHMNSANNFGGAPDGSGVGQGAATISLRSLGSKRTLILVDGLRWVNGSSASGVSASVDLNTIPTGAIDRIEILANGASPLYGSDAIGGVINIITKKSQDGAAAHVYYGDHSVGAGNVHRTDLSFGGKGDRYQFFLDLSHLKQTAISSTAWGVSDQCVPGTGLANCSAYTANGIVRFQAPNGNTYGGLCPNGICHLAPNGVAADGKQTFPSGYHQFTGADRYFYPVGELLLTPSKRTGFFANVTYKVTDNVKMYLRGTYSQRDSSSTAAPVDLGIGPVQCGPTSVCFHTNVDVTNPYNPFGFTLDASNPNTGAARRLVEFGPRIPTQKVDTRYFAGGFTGFFDVGDHEFNWDVNFVRATNDATQRIQGTFSATNVQKALGPLADCTADANCVPLNIFGGAGTITQDMLDYIRYVPFQSSHQGMGLASANISGNLLRLPAGSLDFAAGYAHRNMDGNFMPDANAVANGTLPTSGGYKTDEAYVELNIPLLANKPGFKSLNLDVASRYTRNSIFGGTANSKAGFYWQVYDDLTLRGTWGQGFRAPSIGELYSPVLHPNLTIVDPCNYNSALMSPQVAANCKTLGVPDPSTFQQANIQISTSSGGNIHLQPERSRGITLGGVYSPAWAANTSWSQRLDFTLTYYKTTIRNVIEVADPQSLLNRCALTLDPSACGQQKRNAAGFLVLIQNTLQNIGRTDTSGFDFGVNWQGVETGIGRFGASVQGTYVKEFRTMEVGSGTVSPKAPGIEVDTSAIPRLSGRFRINWQRQNWRAAWTMRYISGLTEGCGRAAGFPICEGAPSPRFPAGTHHIGTIVYNDARVTWTLPITLPTALTLGVNNIFGRDASPCVTCRLNGYDATTYDLPGRLYYISANVKF
ncbi:MAG: TonB-dependent receptor plug domain-containing protein [Rhodanobacteraceae bacterium]